MAETVPPNAPRGDSPAAELRQAAQLLRKRAEEAAPGARYMVCQVAEPREEDQ